MSADVGLLTEGLDSKIQELVEARVEKAIASKLDELLQGRLERALVKKQGTRRLAIVASKGTLDMAYPPLILATAAAAMGWEVGVFFTFYGLDIVNRKKNHHLKVPSLANPAMPVPVPNIVGAIPGMTAMATTMMKGWLKRGQIPSIVELLDIAKASDVKLFACTTTMGVMGVSQENLIEGADCAGAAGFWTTLPMQL